MKLTTIDIISVVLVIIGGLNWGLIGLVQVDVVASVLGGAASVLSRIAYVLVGLAAIYFAVISVKLEKR